MAAIHKFEEAGLGAAPYRFQGVEKKVYQACHGAPIQPGSHCDFCGTCIMYEFKLISADGNQFKVGSECINKSGDAGLIKIAKRENRKRQLEREEERIKAAFDLWDDESIPLSMTPRDEGYINFCRANAGHSGLLRCARMIEKAAKEAS